MNKKRQKPLLIGTWRPGETEQVQHEIKKKKNISKFNHYRYVTTLITVHSTVFEVLCSRKFIGRCLEISITQEVTD